MVISESDVERANDAFETKTDVNSVSIFRSNLKGCGPANQDIATGHLIVPIDTVGLATWHLALPLVGGVANNDSTVCIFRNDRLPLSV